MWVGVTALFPDIFKALNFGITGRTLERGLLNVQVENLRDYASDRHHTVDDRPYGGGPGMVLKAEVLQEALLATKAKAPGPAKVCYLSPQGPPLTHERVKFFAQQEALILICGRYEGIDERFVETWVDEECSIGDYVLSGGEFAALVLIDAIARLIPGALGDENSATEDSFCAGILDYPHYTRPEVYEGKAVPPVLLGGNHEAIRRWRMEQALERTWLRRPDLLENMLRGSQNLLNAEQQGLLNLIKRKQCVEEKKGE